MTKQNLKIEQDNNIESVEFSKEDLLVLSDFFKLLIEVDLEQKKENKKC